MEIKKVKLPKTLDALPIGKFQAICNAMNDEYEVPEELIFQIVAAYLGVPIEEVLNIDVRDVVDLGMAIQELLGSYKEKKPAKEVEVQGVKYVMADSTEFWTAGQYLDVFTHEGELSDDWAKIMALIYVEKGSEYDNESMSKRADIFRQHFPSQVYLDMAPFFLNSGNQSTNGFSEKLKRRQRIKNFLKRNGTKAKR